MSVILLTALVGNTSVSNFIFSPNLSSETAAIMVGINSLLYMLVTVHPNNFNRILQSGRNLLRKNRFIKKLKSNIQDLVSDVTTSTVYNFLYQGFIQGVLNWDNLENLLSMDVISLVLRNVGITVTVSTAWKLAIDQWEEKGRISAQTKRRLSAGRTMIMVTLGTLMSMGIPNTTFGMLAFGAIGLEAYLLEQNRDKVENSIEKLKKAKNLNRSYKFDKFMKNPFKTTREGSHSSRQTRSYGSCLMLLSN